MDLHTTRSTTRVTTRWAAAVGGSLLFLAPMAAGLGAGAAPSDAAAAAPNGVATTSATRMTFTGLAGPNRVTVSGFGPNRFLVTDSQPITAGPGCAPQAVAGPLFGVSCRAPLSTDQEPLGFFVDTGAGNDVVTNQSAASMTATGGPGDDTLVGGVLGDSLFDRAGGDLLRGRTGDDSLDTSSGIDDGRRDTLDGGRGDDDLFSGRGNDTLSGQTGDDDMQGGLGADVYDGGSGTDHASYTDSDHGSVRLVVTLDGVADDGQRPLGSTVSEADNVLANVEDLTGNGGDDIFFGTDADNDFQGLGGNDFMEGAEGEDVLRGSSGADRLFSNQFLGALSDGDVDILEGGTDSPDECRVSQFDEDQAIDCEIVDPT